MIEENRYKHWHLSSDEHNILWLGLDKVGASTNTLDAEVLAELDDIHDEIASVGYYKALVIFSKKTSGFIAGADINQFTELADSEQAFDLIYRGQMLMDKIEKLPIPTCAILHGFCLGGGLELALACDYRVAVDDVSMRLGCPEVLLGIHPGWGGTVRLPRLIGAPNALDLILSGRTISGAVAKKMGVIDFLVPERHTSRAAMELVLGKVKPRRAGVLVRWTNAAWVRPFLGRIIAQKLNRKANPLHYPAPFAALHGWQKNGVQGPQAFIEEAKSVSHLIFTNTAQHLLRVFFLRDRLKSFSKATNFSPKHIHVIGAGVMGGDIAAWCAYQGMTVTLQDREPELIAPAIQRAYAFYKKKLTKRRLVQSVMDRLIPDHHGKGIAQADIIIEAVFEDLQEKQAIFEMLEDKAKPSAILATNTSSIPIDEIASALDKPERLVGIHFFNPVAKMQLVEVVRGDSTSPAIIDNACAFVRKIDRLSLPVRGRPGFLINRILMPYLLEAVHLLEEGIPAPVIDKVAVDFGMPMGPIELADTVGLDICLSVADILSNEYNRAVPNILREAVEANHLGRKSGRGFYRYTRAGKPIKQNVKGGFAPHNEVSERLVMSMLNECVAALWEHVVDDPDLLDAGMIFGTGFAPFRGGPMQYIRERGVSDILETLKSMDEQFGKRFEPHPAWDTLFEKEKNTDVQTSSSEAASSV